MKKKYLVIFLAVAAVAVLFVVVQESKPLAVETGRVTRGPLRECVEERGRTQLHDEATVGVLVTGHVGPVLVEEGDRVEAGTVIAEVEDVAVKAAIGEAEARIEQMRALMKGVDAAKPKPEAVRRARAALAQAKASLGSRRVRRTVLEQEAANAGLDLRDADEQHRSGLVSDRELRLAREVAAARGALVRQQDILLEVGALSVEIANAAYHLTADYAADNEFQREAYAAQVRAIESSLTALRDRKKKTVIRSPMKGVVLHRFTRGGRVMPAGTPLVKVGDPGSIEVRADILTDEVRKVRTGQAVELSGEALGGKTVRGSVGRIHPAGFIKISTLGVEQERIAVIVAFDNGEAKLGPGYGVDVKIIISEKRDALVVSERAVFKLKGRRHVFRITGGKARLVPIETGLESDEFFEVASGLDAGDAVILAPPNELADGMRVTPK